MCDVKARDQIVRTIVIEEISEGELDLIVQWGKTAMRTEGRVWDENQDLLLRQLVSVLAEGDEPLDGFDLKRYLRESVPDEGDAIEGSSFDYVGREDDWQQPDKYKDGQLDTGEGMIWQERP